MAGVVREANRDWRYTFKGIVPKLTAKILIIYNTACGSEKIVLMLHFWSHIMYLDNDVSFI